MERSAKTNPAGVQSAANSGTRAKRRVAKHARKQARNGKRFASSENKAARPATKTPDQAYGIRETEEARALLENQLSSLYWWVFNACKMKGFIRAKALDELQSASANDDETTTEQRDFTEDHVSREKQTL